MACSLAQQARNRNVCYSPIFISISVASHSVHICRWIIEQLPEQQLSLSNPRKGARVQIMQLLRKASRLILKCRMQREMHEKLQSLSHYPDFFTNYLVHVRAKLTEEAVAIRALAGLIPNLKYHEAEYYGYVPQDVKHYARV